MATIQNIMGSKRREILIVLCLEIALLVLFGIFARYSTERDSEHLAVYPNASDFRNSVHYVYGGYKPESNPILKYYDLFQDVHVMIYIGFGFLMTFLKRYGFSSVGYNFLLASLVTQWALICEGFFEMENSIISIGIKNLLRADVAAAAVLISMGAVLGRTSYLQLLVMGVIEIAVFSANSNLCMKIFQITDAGDSITVHAFGAYFGLAVSYVLGRKHTSGEDHDLEGSNYTSDLFAMIGTVFLWMFWPSFNSAELTGDQQHRAVINTYLSLTSCCVISFAMSSAFTQNHKFDMVHIQNSTLAGGVAIGTAANLMMQPYGALIVGVLAGTLSVFGYSKLTPIITKHLGIRDTCGVHNLHGMPAVLAALVSALMAGIASEEVYGQSLYCIFQAMAPVDYKPPSDSIICSAGLGRQPWEQAGFQVLAVVVTIAIAIVSGLITGAVISTTIGSTISKQDAYSDDLYWLIHEQHNNHAPIKVETVSQSVCSDTTILPGDSRVLDTRI